MALLKTRLLLIVALGSALGVLAALNAGGSAAGVRMVKATDPVLGTWLISSRRTDLGGEPQHTMRASGTGFDLVTDTSYKSNAPGGVTFSVLERASGIDYGNPECQIAAGTVVAHFIATKTDAAGVRHYEGQMLQGKVDGTCALIGLQGHYYVKLVQWSDPAQQPPLADGPTNRLCISDTYDGCYVTFDRKGGTAVPGGTATTQTTTTTTTTASGSTWPVSGLVPRNPKIPRDKRFVTDHTPPTVKAVASRWRHGSLFFLDYRSKDDRGFAGETYAIFRGKKLLKRWGVLAGERDGRLQRAPSTLPASIHGSLIFCVGAQDMNGNRSRWSCASLTIS